MATQEDNEIDKFEQKFKQQFAAAADDIEPSLIGLGAAVKRNLKDTVVRLLTDAPELATRLDSFAMEIAVGCGNLEIAKILHGKGAQLTPNVVACALRLFEPRPFLEWLESRGADIEAGREVAREWLKSDLTPPPKVQ